MKLLRTLILGLAACSAAMATCHYESNNGIITMICDDPVVSMPEPHSSELLLMDGAAAGALIFCMVRRQRRAKQKP
jgi:hypothetical protein